ncbi:MAG: GAF domain-containing protein [Verrucomicrobiota bacterium]
MASRTDGLQELLSGTPDWTAVLDHALAAFACVTGTIHRTDPATGLLRLVAQRGIPPALLAKVDAIPFGKGIAGCAAERKDAVQLCNLQQDLGGVAKPDARQTNVQGALAVPVLSSDGKVLGVLGVGKMQPYDFSEAEIADLKACAGLISAKM